MSLEDSLYRFLPIYQRLPSGLLKTAVGLAYRQLPARLRLGSSYENFRGLARESVSWSKQEILDYQMVELQRTLSHAGKYSTYYARRFAEVGFKPEQVGSVEDLERCPTLEKGDIVALREEIAATSPPPSRRLYMTTSGTSGTPLGFFLQKGISRPKERAFLDEQWRRAGFFDRARVVMLRASVTTARADGPIATFDALRGWLLLSSYHLSEVRLPEYLAQVEKFRPDVLHAYPGTALRLAELIERSGTVWPAQLRCVLAGSEKLESVQKAFLEETFRCRVFSWYGHSERVVLAGQGKRSDSFYFWPSYGFVEFGPPDLEGMREVIGTTFHNLVMPLIRYRTGDYVRLHQSELDGPQEFDWPAVTVIEGRGQQFLVTATGRRVPVTPLMVHNDAHDGLYSIQLVQNRPGELEFCYIPRRSFETSQLSRIESILRRKIGDDMTLTFRAVDDVEKTSRGKGKWFISHIPDQDSWDRSDLTSRGQV